ncbi:MAG: hypothetical protein OEQ53_14315 [Saprospiraceae bacterium]|nr:hypothetical protein [Saprospiraceae bacterium]
MNTIIQTPTPDLKRSLDFYERLQFKILSTENCILVSDGKVLLEINPDRFARAGLKLYAPSWQFIIEKIGINANINKLENCYLLVDPSGVWIYLIEGERSHDVGKYDSSLSVLGNFEGVSLESTDLKKSMAVWTGLGFKKTSGSTSAGWVTLQNQDGMNISIMKHLSCPHLFFNPSLTYFNGKENNPKIIQQIRDLQIPITEEITQFNTEGVVDNIIIRDPGGLGFFIFND